MAGAVPVAALSLNAVDMSDPRVVLQDDGIGAPEISKLFGTEIKRDQNVQNNGQRGHDAFLRNGSTTNGASFGFFWGNSGTTYDWSLYYDGNLATLSIGDESATINVNPDAPWNVVSFFLRADDTTRFDTSSVTLTTTTANGQALSVPYVATATDGQVTTPALALDNFTPINNIGGKLAFSFTPKPGASGTPNSRLSAGVTGTNVTPTPPAVPLPAALPLLLAGLGGLAVAGRRRRG